MSTTAQIAASCTNSLRGMLVNVVDMPDSCDFTTPKRRKPISLLLELWAAGLAKHIS